MSFAFDIKQEVLTQELNIEHAHALISGLIMTSSERIGPKTIIKMNNQYISETIKDMMDQLEIKYEMTPENKNWIVLKSFEPVKEIKQPSYYFAGTFVGGGSISDIDSNSYHLEIQLYSHAAAESIKNFLNKYSFKFTLIQRRKLFVLYIKKSEQISDFLRAIQAFNSLMKFEEARITRDFHNQLNRYSNLDTYNQQKLANASTNFVKMYTYIKENGLISNFRDREIDFFELKMENQFSSLGELVKLYYEKTGISKTRAGLNHWIIKLRTIFNNSKND